jgi:hypothetical protein
VSADIHNLGESDDPSTEIETELDTGTEAALICADRRFIELTTSSDVEAGAAPPSVCSSIDAISISHEAQATVMASTRLVNAVPTLPMGVSISYAYCWVPATGVIFAVRSRLSNTDDADVFGS